MDDAASIAAFTDDTAENLSESDITASRAFVRSFVEEVPVEPGRERTRYTSPCPQNSPLKGKDTEMIALQRPVLATVPLGGKFGGAGGDRTLYLFNAIEALSRVSYSPIR